MTPGGIKSSGPFGIAGEGAVAFAVDPSGGAAYTITYGGNPGFFVFGRGAIAGVQGSVSSAKTVQDLAGTSVNFSFSVGAGLGFGFEVGASNSATTFTGTVGYAIGTKGAGFTATNTIVIPAKCQ